MTEQETTSAGWYPDAGGHQLRWWDGAAWTTHVAPLPSAANPTEAALLAERKRVYSHDMLYVTDATGTKIGRVNLDSGKVTMDQPARRAEFDQFVIVWREHNTEAPAATDDHGDNPAGSAGTEHDPPPSTDDTTPPAAPRGDAAAWNDLAQNRPGQAVRERAV